MRTIIYIDGLNLYYRALKGTRHKWLDLEALSYASLPPNLSIAQINYYTTRVSGRIDPNGPKDQHAYLRARDQATDQNPLRSIPDKSKKVGTCSANSVVQTRPHHPDYHARPGGCSALEN